MIQATGKIAGAVVEGLRDQPLALALVVINVLFLGLVGYTLYQVSERGIARDALIAKLAQECQQALPKP